MSSLTFKDLAGHLGYIKVIWNNKIVYEDTTIEDLHNFEDKYNDKIVYKAEITICDFHHCIIEIQGEE